MIAFTPTSDKDGAPIDSKGKKLSTSSYQPIQEVKNLFAQVQVDYGMNWRLQHQPFKEFDGLSLLDRTRVDQETFGAYVGFQFDHGQGKNWRWRGRKNTARNKILSILAHLISGMLFPFVYAYNNENKEDKLTARVMQLLIENHLKKANYEVKFLYMVLTALVQPAVIMEIEYVEMMQKIKMKLADDTYSITECVDELLSGVQLNNIPIDQHLPSDYYTNDPQRQPNIMRVRRIPYDEARKIYAGKYKHMINGELRDPFDFVSAGNTRWLLAGQENQVLYDIKWTEADDNYVQVLNCQYRSEDLEVEFVGGVFFGNETDIYNSNPFSHRRFTLVNGNEWSSIPIYNIAKSGFEPIDPTGRFYYYKSAANKEYWDDAGVNRMHQIAYDGTFLDTIKPLFVSGVTKIDGTVLIPGATIGIPSGAEVTPYNLSPNLAATLKMLQEEKDDMTESTTDPLLNGKAEAGVTAYATARAMQNATKFFGLASIMVADLVRQLGELTMDCCIQFDTVGQIDATIPSSLSMKYKTVLMKGKSNGKDITNRIDFTTEGIGRNDVTSDQANKLEWDLFEKAGGIKTDQHVYQVNPYKFARHKFSLYCDADLIISKSMGTDQLRRDRMMQIMTNPAIAPFVDMEAFADDVIESVTDGDPDKFKKKGDSNMPPAGSPPMAPVAPVANGSGQGQTTGPVAPAAPVNNLDNAQ